MTPSEHHLTTRTLYVTDLDGTLLNSDGIVAKSTLDIFHQYPDELLSCVTIATARTFATVNPLLNGSGINRVEWITMTGALLYRADRQEFLPPKVLARDDASILLDLFLSCDLNPFVYFPMSDKRNLRAYHINGLTDIERDFMRQREALLHKSFDISDNQLRLNDIFAETTTLPILFLGMGEPERIYRLADILNLHTRFSVSAYDDTYTDHVAYIEVFTAGVAKSEAIRQVARRNNFQRVVVFGDNLNDISMMRIADEAVAVANAVEKVRQVADTIIGSNDDDSVSKYILNDYLQHGKQ